MPATTGMDMSTPTSAAMPTASAKGMGGMGMGGSRCKISMLFNLYTTDACFLSSQWRITSNGAFAASCIGVFFLTLALEMLRRSIKEYDRYLIKQHISRHQTSSSSAAGSSTALSPTKDPAVTAAAAVTCSAVPPFRPNALQQAVRAFLHMLAFFVGYILMLLAMYYNGYILICIFLGAYVGAFLFQWETILPGTGQTSAAHETTVCCG